MRYFREIPGPLLHSTHHTSLRDRPRRERCGLSLQRCIGGSLVGLQNGRCDMSGYAPSLLPAWTPSLPHVFKDRRGYQRCASIVPRSQLPRVRKYNYPTEIRHRRPNLCLVNAWAYFSAIGLVMRWQEMIARRYARELLSGQPAGSHYMGHGRWTAHPRCKHRGGGLVRSLFVISHRTNLTRISSEGPSRNTAPLPSCHPHNTSAYGITLRPWLLAED